MTQQVQGLQTGPHAKALANIALAGTTTNSSSPRLASPVVAEVVAKLVPGVAPISDSDAVVSGGAWAIELQETQYLPPLRRSLPPAPPVASPSADGGMPHPNLGARPLGITLLCCLLLLLVVGALDGMQQYARVHAQVDDAYSHLHDATSLLQGRQFGQPLSASALAQVGDDLSAAQADFDALHAELGSPSGVVLIGTFVPHLSARLAQATRLASAGSAATQGLQSLVAASNDILELHAAGFLDANGNLTRRGRLSPASGLLMLHLHAALTSAAGPLSAADTAISSADLMLLPATLANPAQVTSLGALQADWPQTRAQLLAPDGWRLLIPFVLGIQAPSH